MEFISYTTEMQNKLDDFFNTMYSARGLKYDPLGRHNDLRNIAAIYQEGGGGYKEIT